MRIAALEESLKKSSVEDLERLVAALDTGCALLPEQLIQELGLRTLAALTRLVVQDKKKGGCKDERICG
jgi:hypothetical protein